MSVSRWIQRPERLVHQEQPRIGRERARDADALPLSARELARATSGRTPPPASRPGTAAAAHARRGVPGPVEETGHRLDVVLHAPVREEPALLDHVADAPPERDGILLADRGAEHADFARNRRRAAGWPGAARSSCRSPTGRRAPPPRPVRPRASDRRAPASRSPARTSLRTSMNSQDGGDRTRILSSGASLRRDRHRRRTRRFDRRDDPRAGRPPRTGGRAREVPALPRGRVAASLRAADLRPPRGPREDPRRRVPAKVRRVLLERGSGSDAAGRIRRGAGSSGIRWPTRSSARNSTRSCCGMPRRAEPKCGKARRS